MKVTCGTDIIEIDRIKNSIDKFGKTFINRIYTKNEIDYCESKKNQKYQHYAVRFAAKEAIFKAISSELKEKYEVSWKDLEIVNDCNGRPIIKFNEDFFSNIESQDISLSHCKNYAVANVVIIWR